ncbi:Peptidase S26A [Macleaya cordata]|uniref:Peptidase S26A n=1 Tax=Macleaya cordata TaxID=56857 RepID=A0A200PW09_MACCD|nr:Peptidase S26A [Macleaya cordata]
MVSLSTWFRYIAHKFEYSVSLSWKSYKIGQISDRQVNDAVWKNVFQGKLTYLHWNKGQEMAPTIGEQGGTLLVRKLADPTRVFVGDVVVVKDPEKSDDYLVRRLAATEGYEMVSTDEKEEPFVLEKDQCWLLSDNEALKPKEAKDSRTFGPVPMTDIVGRVIYCLRTAVDHGPVQNSRASMQKDSPVIAVELDVDEMAKNHKV